MIRKCVYKNPECKFIRYDGTNHNEIETEWGDSVGSKIYDDKSFYIKDSDGDMAYCEIGDYIVEHTEGINLYGEIDFNKHFNIKE